MAVFVDQTPRFQTDAVPSTEQIDALPLSIEVELPFLGEAPIFGEIPVFGNEPRREAVARLNIEDERIAVPGLRADLTLKAEVGVGLALQNPTLGDFKLDFPVRTMLVLPDEVRPGETIEIGTSNYLVIDAPTLEVESFSIGDAKLEFIFGVEDFRYEDITLDVLGLQRNFDDIVLPQVKPPAQIPIAQFQAGIQAPAYAEAIWPWLDAVSLVPGEGRQKDSNTGPRFTEETGLEGGNLEVDFGEPLRVFNAQISVFDLLSFASQAVGTGTLVVPGIGVISAATLTALSQFFGRLSGDIPLGPLGELSYAALRLDVNVGLDVNQSVSFHPGGTFLNPEGVGVSIEIADQVATGFRDGALGALGERFEFRVPEDAQGPLTGTITYDLGGTVVTNLTFAPAISVEVTPLSLEGDLSLGPFGQLNPSIQLPKFKVDLPGDVVGGPLTGGVELRSEQLRLGPRQFEFSIPLASASASASASDLPSGGTGTGGTGGTGDAIDWNALADRVQAYFNATGQWGLLSDWLSDNPPDKNFQPPVTEDIDWAVLSQRVTAYYENTGQWGLLEDWLTPPPPDGGSTDYLV